MMALRHAFPPDETVAFYWRYVVRPYCECTIERYGLLMVVPEAGGCAANLKSKISLRRSRMAALMALLWNVMVNSNGG
jgi:hypothetical protein